MLLGVSMRTLCLDLKKHSYNQFTDNFLTFSNKLKFRRPGLLFADVTETLNDFKNEKHFLTELKNFNEEFFPNVSAAIANNPINAQVFTKTQNQYSE